MAAKQNSVMASYIIPSRIISLGCLAQRLIMHFMQLKKKRLDQVMHNSINMYMREFIAENHLRCTHMGKGIM